MCIMCIIITSYTHLFISFQDIGILTTYNHRHTLELITEMSVYILYLNMHFKPCIVKTQYFTSVHCTNVCNVSIQPSIVMHLHEDGRKNGRNVQEEYYVCSTRHLIIYVRAFVGSVTISNLLSAWSQIIKKRE